MRHASLPLPLSLGFATRNGRFGARADGTLHGDIHQRRLAGGEGALESGRQSSGRSTYSPCPPKPCATIS